MFIEFKLKNNNKMFFFFFLPSHPLKVEVYHACGFDHHYHSFPLRKQTTTATYWLAELADYQTFRAHCKNNCLYVTLHSHVENTSAS